MSKFPKIKSYEQLKYISSNFRKKLNHCKKDLKILGFSVSDTLFVMCLRLFSKNLLKQKEKFTTNIYFQESLKIDQLPNDQIIINIAKSLNDDCIQSKKIRKEFSKLNKNKKQIQNWEWLIENVINLCEDKNNKNILKLFGHKEEKFLSKNGYLIINGVLSNRTCNILEKKINKMALYERNKNKSFVYGDKKAQRVYNLLAKDKIFQDLICHPLVIKVMDYWFDRPNLHDKYYLSSWHANILNPKAKDGMLHIDAAVPEPIPEWIIKANVSFIIHDHNKNNGATLCVPKSHKWAKIPPRYSDTNYKLLPLEAPKGSVVFWNGHLWHKSGRNTSADSRIALLGCFAASFLREMSLEENHFEIIPRKIKHSMSDQMRRLIGNYHGIKKGSTCF